MIIELTELSGTSIYINKNKILKFNNVEESDWHEKKTEIQMESCFIYVKETPQNIVAIINK